MERPGSLSLQYGHGGFRVSSALRSTLLLRPRPGPTVLPPGGSAIRDLLVDMDEQDAQDVPSPAYPLHPSLWMGLVLVKRSIPAAVDPPRLQDTSPRPREHV